MVVLDYGLALILARDRLPSPVAVTGLAVMAAGYIAGAVAVIRLGAA